jgi:alkylated DNA repair dioxygenase AlkB
LKNEAVIFGKLIITKEGRLVWRYYSYTYSKRTKQALIWTPRLALKTSEEKLEKPTILVLLYHTGTEGMGWHSDAEKT